MPKPNFSAEELLGFKNRRQLVALAERKQFSIRKQLRNLRYQEELELLQAQMVNLQRWVARRRKRVAIILEGRGAAGKGGTIKRFVEHLNPRSMRVVALTKPTEIESGQWYFRRYVKELPNPGEMVFFDRSWYNRAVVEPVMGFCTPAQYSRFMVQVPEFEHMLYEDGIHIIKFWFSISRDEQEKRFRARLDNPLKIWKFSPVDMRGQELWGDYTHYKEQMFSRTHTAFWPWTIVRADNKRKARLESIRHVLSQFNYAGRTRAKVPLAPDPNIVVRYYRHIKQLDI